MFVCRGCARRASPKRHLQYGLIEAHERPVILLKEENATVDVKSLIGEAVNLAVTTPALNIDSHFSDIKGVNYAIWSRLNPASAVKTDFAGIQKEEIQN